MERLAPKTGGMPDSRRLSLGRGSVPATFPQHFGQSNDVSLAWPPGREIPLSSGGYTATVAKSSATTIKAQAIIPMSFSLGRHTNPDRTIGQPAKAAPDRRGRAQLAPAAWVALASRAPAVRPPSAPRAHVERATGVDLEQARVHTGATVDTAAEALGREGVQRWTRRARCLRALPTGHRRREPAAHARADSRRAAGCG